MKKQIPEIASVTGTTDLEIQAVISQVDFEMKDLHIWIYRCKFWQAFHVRGKNSVSTWVKGTMLLRSNNISLSTKKSVPSPFYIFNETSAYKQLIAENELW